MSLVDFCDRCSFLVGYAITYLHMTAYIVKRGCRKYIICGSIYGVKINLIFVKDNAAQITGDVYLTQINSNSILLGCLCI